MGDEAVAVEELPEVPASLLSPLWGTLLSVGGLVLVVGSLTYSVIQMSAYETEIDSLRAQLGQAPEVVEPIETPVPIASVEPTAEPSETPSAPPSPPPTVYVTETVAAAPAPTRAPPRQPVPGAANPDRTRQLQAQVSSLQAQLRQSQADLAAARREADSARQCSARLDRAQSTARDAQAALERAQAACRTGSSIRDSITRPPVIRPTIRPQ